LIDETSFFAAEEALQPEIYYFLLNISSLIQCFYCIKYLHILKVIGKKNLERMTGKFAGHPVLKKPYLVAGLSHHWRNLKRNRFQEFFLSLQSAKALFAFFSDI